MVTMEKVKNYITIIAAGLLLSFGFNIHDLTASGFNDPAAKDSLIIKQYSVDSFHELRTDRSATDESRMTFLILAGYDKPLNSEHLLNLLQSSIIAVEGVEFNFDKAELKSGRRLVVPFVITTQFETEFLESVITIRDQPAFAEQSMPVSLYRLTNHTMVVNLKGEYKRNVSQLSIIFPYDSNLIWDGFINSPNYYAAIQHMKDENNDELHPGSFVYRNRFWVVGVATLAVGASAAIMNASGSSAAYLPEPPGRPGQ